MISNNLFSLKGKTALVTGGSSGIGLMATVGLVSAGAKVFIVSRKIENCQNAANELNNRDFDGEVVPFKGDLSSEAGINNIIDEIYSKNSELHILINNAGRTWGSDFSSFPSSRSHLVQITISLRSRNHRKFLFNYKEFKNKLKNEL